MTRDRPAVHVVFNQSAAGTLKLVLPQIGCNDQVVGFFDDLSFGPIGSDPFVRQRWVEDELGLDDWREIIDLDDLTWSEIASAEARPVAWVHRRSAQEHAGFLEFLIRIGETEFGVVDLTDAIVAGRDGTFTPDSFGVVSPEQIIQARLFERETVLPRDQLLQYREKWDQLKKENAPFRILDGSGLVSAQITHFDSVIASHIEVNWKNCARVIGYALADQFDGPFPQTGDLVIWGRLRSLCEAGVFDFKGDLSNMHDSFVRKCVSL